MAARTALFTVLGCLAVPACFYDAMPSVAGPDTSTSSQTTTAERPVTTGQSPDTTTDLPANTSSTTTTISTTTTADATTTTTDTVDTSTTISDACGEQVTITLLALVEDAEVTSPMEKKLSDQDEGIVASSPTAFVGTVTFTLEIPCAGTYRAWGRVYDALTGVNPDDPDSFIVSADDAPEFDWRYGCQTTNGDPLYTWQQILQHVGETCDEQPWPLELTAGTHTITLRNREAESMGNQKFRAGIARILVTSDLEYVPTTD